MDIFVVLLLLAIDLTKIKGTKNDAIFPLHERASEEMSLLLGRFRLFFVSIIFISFISFECGLSVPIAKYGPPDERK